MTKKANTKILGEQKSIEIKCHVWTLSNTSKLPLRKSFKLTKILSDCEKLDTKLVSDWLKFSRRRFPDTDLNFSLARFLRLQNGAKFKGLCSACVSLLEPQATSWATNPENKNQNQNE